MKKKTAKILIVRISWGSAYKWVLKASNGHRMAQSYKIYDRRETCLAAAIAAKKAMTAGVIQDA